MEVVGVKTDRPAGKKKEREVGSEHADKAVCGVVKEKPQVKEKISTA